MAATSVRFFKGTMIYRVTTSGNDQLFQDEIRRLPELVNEPELQLEMANFLSENKRWIGWHRSLFISTANVFINYQRHTWMRERHWFLASFDARYWSPLGVLEVLGCLLLAGCYLFITVGSNIAAYFLEMVAFNVASFGNRVVLALECYAAFKFGMLDATVLWMLVVDRALFAAYLTVDFSKLAAHPEDADMAKEFTYKRKVIVINLGIQLIAIFGMRFIYFIYAGCHKISSALPSDIESKAKDFYEKNQAGMAAVERKPNPTPITRADTPSICETLSPYQRVQLQNMRTWFMRRGNTLLDMTSGEYRRQQLTLRKVATKSEKIVKLIFVGIAIAGAIWLLVGFEGDPILFTGTACASALMVIDLLLRAFDDATEVVDVVDYFIRQVLYTLVMLPLSTTMLVFRMRGKVLMDSKIAQYGFASGQAVAILFASLVTDFIRNWLKPRTLFREGNLSDI